MSALLTVEKLTIDFAVGERTVHAVRQLSPEVKAHLTSAAASLVHAAAGIMATAAQTPSSNRGGVEHINLDDTAEDWPEENS